MSSIADLEFSDADGVPVAHVSGEIDMSVTAALEERLGRAVPDGAPGLVLDLTELEYIDSSGLRLLLQLKSGLDGREKGLRTVVVEGSPVYNLLVQTGTDEMLAVDREVAAAVAGLKGA